MNRDTRIFALVLIGAMAGSSFSLFALSVLAADLIDAFDLTRGQIGILAAANTASGALLAPSLGRLTDRIGGRRSVVMLLSVTVIGLTTIALARSYAVLIVGAVLGGAPQGWGNPATNKLIGDRLERGSRGIVIGLKQSGVQVSVFLAGLTLPIGANVFGWRWAVGFYAAMTIVLIVFAATVLDSDAPPTSAGRVRHTHSRERVGAFVFVLATYAFLLGVVSGGVNRFIPLFAHEELGYSTTIAGLATALNGLAAIGSRIWWSHRAELRGDTVNPLVTMALGSAVVGLLLAVATTIGPWLIWPIAVLGAFSVSAWNGVAMLRVINGSSPESAGRASGIVVFGFLGGLAVGAPLVGWSVDRWETYTPAWLTLVVLALVASVVLRSPASRSAGA